MHSDVSEGSDEVEEHFTDPGGASDHVFALFAFIGKRFAPRLRNLKDRKFHTEKAGTLSGIDQPYRRADQDRPHLEHWVDLLHLAASITTQSVILSTILRSLPRHRNPAS